MNKTIPKISNATGGHERLKDWTLIALLAAFVVLYGLAFAGKLDPFRDNTMLLRFEPIIFIFIGYYFGRLPSRQAEKVLHEEIARQSQRADAAQFAKEKALQERDSLEERIKNASRGLKAIDSSGDQTERKAVTTAVRILDS